LLSSSESDRLRVVLVAARNPLNIGAAARAMSNFGFLRLRVVNPYDVAFREARSAVGAPQLLAKAEEFKSVADAVADCELVVGTTALRRREAQHPLRLLPAGGKLIRQRLTRGKVALLFGSEKVGLSNEDLSHCHWLMRVPTREAHVSMNLGQAVAVCLYELIRGRTSALPTSKSRPASAKEVERLTESLLEALTGSGYLEARPSATNQQKIRRLVRRLALTHDDAELWLGMLRQMVWKVSSKR
jgi:TrmH family RNA methyltransferase